MLVSSAIAIADSLLAVAFDQTEAFLSGHVEVSEMENPAFWFLLGHPLQCARSSQPNDFVGAEIAVIKVN